MQITEIAEMSKAYRGRIEKATDALIASKDYADLRSFIEHRQCSMLDLANFLVDFKVKQVQTKDGVDVSYFLPTHTGTDPFIIVHFEWDTSITDKLSTMSYWPIAQERNTFMLEGKKLPSASRILGHVFDDEEDVIANWIERVGEEYARAKMLSSSTRGTALHSKLEDFISNIDVDLDLLDESKTQEEREYELYIHRLFCSLRPMIESRVKKVYGLEVPLVSKVLNAGGRLDLLCDYINKLTLADFKSSEKKLYRSSEKVKKYFSQMILYAIMLYELCGIWVEQCVLLVATDTGESQEIIIENGSEEWNSLAAAIISRSNAFQPIFEQQEEVRIGKSEQKRLLKEKLAAKEGEE